MSRKTKSFCQKPRVLISGHLPPPIGGMGTYYQILVNSSLGNYVTYQFVQTSSHKRDLATSGRLTISNLVSAIGDCARYTHAILSFHPQVAHIGTAFGLSFLKNSYCVLLSRFLQKKVLLHPHCSFSYLYTDRSKLWQSFFRQIIRLTDGVIVLSNEWHQLEEIVPGSKVHFLPNAIDPSEFLNAYNRRVSTTSSNKRVTVLYLGYLGKAKGTFDLIDAIRTVVDEGLLIRFKLVGSELSPGEMYQIKEKISAMNLQGSVDLIKPVLGEEKLELLENSDIFIYPSYHEGIPMAVLEAMASGLPIIATKVGGLPDLVKNGVNGFLVKAAYPNGLAKAISTLAQNPGVRIAMGKNSQKMVLENYDIEQHVKNLVKIYSKTYS